MTPQDIKPGDVIVVNHIYFKMNLDGSFTATISSTNDLASEPNTSQRGYLKWTPKKEDMRPRHLTPAPQKKRQRIKYVKA